MKHFYFPNKKAKKSYRTLSEPFANQTSALNVEAKIVMMTNTFRLAVGDNVKKKSWRRCPRLICGVKTVADQINWRTKSSHPHVTVYPTHT